MNAPENFSDRRVRRSLNGNGGLGGHLFSKVWQCNLGYLFAPWMRKLDASLALGSVEGTLPDGSPYFLGGRKPGPVARIDLHSWKALLRISLRGASGWYEAWANKEWSSPDPIQFFIIVMRNRQQMGFIARTNPLFALPARFTHWLHRNSKKGSRRNIEVHYDLGNEFYQPWLDQSLTYSSAMFAPSKGTAESLEDAQARKIDALLDRLEMRDGQSLLEIGCGWGSLADRVLAQTAIKYHGITLSKEQLSYAKARLADYKQAQVSLTDYRDVDGQYDAIASVEMVEAVGQSYWPIYLDTLTRLLKPGGRAALQYISISDDAFERYAKGTDFIQDYIFPGGLLLSESRFKALAEERGFSWTRQVDFGIDYAETLRQWRGRFDKAVTDGALPKKFDEKFIGLWRYYLMYCEGGFRGGGINVSQVTLIKQH